MNAEEKAFDRGLVVGMVGAALALAALIWAASPTETWSGSPKTGSLPTHMIAVVS